MSRQQKDKNFKQLKQRSQEVSALLKQLSHPQRLLIMCSLTEGEKSVGEIEEASGASQSAVSQYLKAMRLDGLVEATRDGKQIFYRIADPRVHELLNSLFTIFCK